MLPCELVLAAPLPLLLAIRFVSVRRATALGLLASSVANAVGFHWVPQAIAHLQQSSWSFGAALLAPLVVWQAVPVVVFAAVVASMWSRGGAWPPAVAGLWVVVEWSFPSVLPWTLGGALARSPLLRQAADLGGVHLLSFAIVLTNACAVAGIEARGRRRFLCVVGALATLGSWLAYGMWASHAYGQQDGDGPDRLRVAIVQGNLGADSGYVWPPDLDWWSPYAALSRAAAAHDPAPQVIVWPETVVRAFVGQDEAQLRRLRQLASETEAALLVGGWDRSDAGADVYNAAFLIAPGGMDTHREKPLVYRKHHLLPFGEYLPAGIRHFVPFWKASFEFAPAPREADPLGFRVPAARGNGTTSETVAAAASICLEALLPGSMNAGVRGGAQWLVNLTDDGWFAGSMAPEQHLSGASLRAVETRRPLLRASNSGISAVIGADGTIERELAVGVAGVLHAAIPCSATAPVYARYGEWIVALSALLLAHMVVRVIRPIERGSNAR